MNRWESKRLGSPKVTLGSPTILTFCIKIGSVEGIGAFFLSKTGRLLSEELLPFAIKYYSFPVERRLVGFQMCCHG